MGVKVLGLGCVNYWADGWNQLDGVIVSMSIVEMLATAIEHMIEASGGGVSNVSFLRMLRLLRLLRVARVLRLMRAWRGLHTILSTFVEVVPQMGNIFILICLTIFTFALFGMQMFGGVSRGGGDGADADASHLQPDHPEASSFNFDHCGQAMVSVFIVLTGEWVDIMEPFISQMGLAWSVFFVAIVVIGKFLLVNLLIAVLLTEFGSKALADQKHAVEMAEQRDVTFNVAVSAARWKRKSVGLSTMPEQEEPVERWPQDFALLIFSPSNQIRRACHSVMTTAAFDRIIILAILISSICLALDSPRLDESSALAHTLRVSDVFFTAVFVLEMAVKVVAMGFACMPEESYLSNPWNRADFIIVCISVLVLLAETLPQLRPLKVLRVLRVLRPLRLISRNAGMKLIITSLFKALPNVVNVLGVVLALQVVFTILGMQLFMGRLASCSSPQLMTESSCLTAGERWATPSFGSFDDFGSAMLMLYVMSSGDGETWVEPTRPLPPCSVMLFTS